MSFPCLKCGKESAVLDTRTQKTPDGTLVRRRRACLSKKCKRRWTTFETVAVKVGPAKYITSGSARTIEELNNAVANKLRALSNQMRAGKL